MDPSALGRYLRESRESREITLEDAVRALRIRRDILESFEQGEFSVMDSTVRVRGMLRNYAGYLGLEEDRVLQYYESANNRSRKRRFGRREKHVELIAPRKITDTQPTLPVVDVTAPSAPSFMARVTGVMGMIAIVLVSVAAVAVIAYVTMDLLDMNTTGSEVVVAPTVIPGSLSATPTNTPTITPRATVLTDTPIPAISITGVQVDVEIEQRSWVSITVDDREQFTGFLEPGYESSFVGNETVIFRAANAAALNVIYNGIQQETFGARGQEVEVVFSTTGVNIMQSTVVPVLASDTPTAMPQVTSTMQAQPEGAVGEPMVNQPTPIPTQILPSPTPLFANNQPETDGVASSVDSAPSATDGASAQIVTNQPAATATAQSPATAIAGAEDEPAATATPESDTGNRSNLPLRATPSNPTPTKTG